MQTLLAMVKGECANYKHGGCMFAADGYCPVTNGKRCSVPSRVVHGGPAAPDGTDYFETCALPLHKVRQEYHDAAQEYMRILRKKPEVARTCECGEVLPKRARLCERCRKIAARLATRKYRARVSELSRNSSMQVVTA